MNYCNACGALAAETIHISVQQYNLTTGNSRRKAVNIHLCATCAAKVNRTLANDNEQQVRIARALTDEGRQLRRDEAYRRRRELMLQPEG